MAKDRTLALVGQITDAINQIKSEATGSELTPHRRRKLLDAIATMRTEVEGLERAVDEVTLPDAFFDPTDPKLIGHFVALALIAQDRRPMATLGRFYGSGVYAIYYSGAAPIYAPISGSETPIYVGKADPGSNAKTLVEQGTKLADRLGEHRKNIIRVTGIDVDDFDYRALAVQSGYQAAAESHLIRLFQPIWNNETRILFGLGKHGDSSTTRANNKSPWDTIHPGRIWAVGNPEAKTGLEIEAEVAGHFSRSRIFPDTAGVFAAFVEGIRSADRIEIANPEDLGAENLAVESDPDA